ncbi:MAG: hypothetical protein ABL949_07750 [Fimbriimonadaceae bacterium]
MYPSTKFLLYTVGIGTFVAGGIWGFPFLAKDAFAEFKEGSGPLGNSTGVQLTNAKMTIYDGDKLVTSANIDTINIRKDQQLFDFIGVTGKSGDPKSPVDFSGKSAVYDAMSETMKFQNGVRLKGKNYDLVAPTLTVDDKFKNLQVPGTTKGTLEGGKVAANDTKLKFKEGTFTTKGVHWTGSLPKVFQDGSPVQTGPKVPWDIQGVSSKGSKKGLLSFTEARASDGDQLIRAKNVDYDQKKDILIATGPAYYYSADVNLVADKITVYRKEKRVLLSGDVRMLVKPKSQADLNEDVIPPFRPDVPESVSSGRPAPPTTEEASQQKDLDDALRNGKTIRDYPALVKATEISYHYAKGARRADISGSPECVQDFPGGRWRRIASHSARYDGEKELLRLISAEGKSDVRLKTSIGDDLKADWFEVSTKESEDDAQDWEGANVRGKFMVDDEEVPKKEEKKSPPPDPVKSGG